MARERKLPEGFSSNPELDEDLIERLAPVSDWPTPIAEICEDGAGNDIEDIAIEHAARKCGSADL